MNDLALNNGNIGYEVLDGEIIYMIRKVIGDESIYARPKRRIKTNQ